MNNSTPENKTRKKWMAFFIRFGITSAILLVIYFIFKDKISLRAISNHLIGLPFSGIVILASFTIFILIVRASNWQLILNLKGQLPFTRFLFPLFAAQTANLVLPAHGGELIRFIYVKNAIPIGTCLGSLIFERLIDILWLLALSSLSLLFFSQKYLLIISLCCLFGTIFILFFCFHPALFNRAKRFIFKHVPSERVKNLIVEYENFLIIFKNSKKIVFTFFLISLIQWILSLIQSWLIFIYLGVHIEIFHVFAIVPIGILISLLPVSVGGLGTREAAFLFLFGGLVIPEKIISFTILFYLFRYLFPGIFGIPFAYLIKLNDRQTTAAQ